MKKVFTSENYLTGFLVSLLAFALYLTFTTITLSWKYVLAVVVITVGFSVIGYVVNKAIEKLSK
jgi:hypothetical protein